MKKQDLVALIDGELRPEGFSRKGHTWYRTGQENLQVIDLQKSTYGLQFYLNICIVPAGASVAGLPTPKERDCPIRIRITSLFPELRARAENALDLENATLSETERQDELLELLKRAVLPFFSRVETIEGLREMFKEGLFKRASVDVEVRQLLSLER